MQGLQSVGISCTHHEVRGEDHFSLVERMRESEEDYSLNKVAIACTTVLILCGTLMSLSAHTTANTPVLQGMQVTPNNMVENHHSWK